MYKVIEVSCTAVNIQTYTNSDINPLIIVNNRMSVISLVRFGIQGFNVHVYLNTDFKNAINAKKHFPDVPHYDTKCEAAWLVYQHKRASFSPSQLLMWELIGLRGSDPLPRCGLNRMDQVGTRNANRCYSMLWESMWQEVQGFTKLVIWDSIHQLIWLRLRPLLQTKRVRQSPAFSSWV